MSAPLRIRLVPGRATVGSAAVARMPGPFSALASDAQAPTPAQNPDTQPEGGQGKCGQGGNELLHRDDPPIGGCPQAVAYMQGESVGD